MQCGHIESLIRPVHAGPVLPHACKERQPYLRMTLKAAPRRPPLTETATKKASWTAQSKFSMALSRVLASNESIPPCHLHNAANACSAAAKGNLYREMLVLAMQMADDNRLAVQELIGQHSCKAILRPADNRLAAFKRWVSMQNFEFAAHGEEKQKRGWPLP